MKVAHQSLQEEIREDFVLGAKGAAISLTAGFITLQTSQFLMNTWGFPIAKRYAFFQFYEHLQSVGNFLLRGVLKTLTIFYIVILVPLIEEWVFREWIYQMQEESGASKIYRVISNGILFGAFHYSFYLGWANIPIIAVTAVAGIVFAALREIRKNSYASTIAHSLNNAAVFLFLNII